MKELVEKTLTDKKTRTEAKMEKIALENAQEFLGWSGL